MASVIRRMNEVTLLRMSNTNLLSVPFVRTSFGARSFNVVELLKSGLSPFSSSNAYQPRQFSSSSQDSLFPAGLPSHLDRGYMCNLLHAICCRGAKIIVQLF